MMNKENNLKVQHHKLNEDVDMIFSEDSILLSLLERYDEEEEMKEAVLKYCQGSVFESHRPEVIESVKGDPSELDMVPY